MKQINCPVNFNKLTTEYDTTNLTVLYSEKKKEGYNGVCTRPTFHSYKRKMKGHWLQLPYISLTIGENQYPYKSTDRYGVEFTANTKEELILFLFWHEFQHYIDGKTNIKTKHKEVSQIAYNRVWG